MRAAVKRITMNALSGKHIRGRILFFIEDDGAEYITYVDDFDNIITAEVIKGTFSWKVGEWDVDRDISCVADHILAKGREQRDRCCGESYRLRREDNKLKYSRISSRGKLDRLAGRTAVKIRAAVVIVLACLLIVMGIFWGAWPVLATKDTQPQYGSVLESLPTEEEYLKYLSPRLTDQGWALVDMEEREDMIQLICDWETTLVLGCSPVNVAVTDLAENVLGYYNQVDGTIYINSSVAGGSDWQELVVTLAHECRHCWQWDMIKLLEDMEKDNSVYQNLCVFDDVRAYRYAWENYVRGSEDYDLYYNQIIERDCRAWAEKRLNEYYLQLLLEE